MKSLLKTIPLYILRESNLGLKGAQIKIKEVVQTYYRNEINQLKYEAKIELKKLGYKLSEDISKLQLV
jgi:hypothetical protein